MEKNACPFWTYKKGFYKNYSYCKNKIKRIADSFPISLCFPQGSEIMLGRKEDTLSAVSVESM